MESKGTPSVPIEEATTVVVATTLEPPSEAQPESIEKKNENASPKEGPLEDKYIEYLEEEHEEEEHGVEEEVLTSSEVFLDEIFAEDQLVEDAHEKSPREVPQPDLPHRSKFLKGCKHQLQDPLDTLRRNVVKSNNPHKHLLDHLLCS